MSTSETNGPAPAIEDAHAVAKTRISAGPPPDWAQVLPVDMTYDPPESDQAVLLLNSVQTHAESKQSFYHTAIRLKTIQAVQKYSQRTLEFEPRTQKIAFHFIRIHRDGRQIEKLDLSNARILNREQGLERFVIDGWFTWLLLLEDVRPGDTLETAYTIESRPRLLSENCDHFFKLSVGAPTGRIYHSVLFDPARPLNWKASSGELAPVEEDNSGLKLWKWDRTSVPAVTPEPNTPDWYIPGSWAQVSDCPDWRHAASAVAAVFRPDESSLVDEIVDEIRNSETELKKQAARAIDFVQNQCRYLSFDLGSGGMVPAPPGTVARRRYGDCKDLSFLLAQLLIRLGIPARPMLVHTGLRQSIADLLPSLSLFNHVVVEFTLEDSRRWVDPTRCGQGGGALGRFISNYSLGLPVDETASALIPAPPPGNEESRYELKESLLLDTVTGTSLFGIVLTARGVHADVLRAQFAELGSVAVAKERLQHCANRFGRANRIGELQQRDDPEANEFSLAEAFEVSGFLTEHGHGRDGYSTFRFFPTVFAGVLPMPQPGPRATPFSLPFPCNLKYEIEIDSRALMDKSPAGRLRHESPFLKFIGSSRTLDGVWRMSADLSTLSDSIAPDKMDQYRRLADAIYRELVKIVTARNGYARQRRTASFGQLPAPKKTEPAEPVAKTADPHRDDNQPKPDGATVGGHIAPADGAQNQTGRPPGPSPEPTTATPQVQPAAPDSRHTDGHRRRRRRRHNGVIRAVALFASVMLVAFGGLVLVAALGRSRPPRKTHGTDVEIASRLRKAAEEGNGDAQLSYGLALMNGRGAGPDPSEAVEWFRKAAAHDIPEAEFFLGSAYAEGRGVSKDEAKAAEYYRTSAEAGVVRAEHNLALCYMRGSGVEKDPAQAVKWFKAAAQKGAAPSQYSLARALLLGQGVENDDFEAVKWLRKSADQGYVEAEYNLGLAYLKGRGVPKDVIEGYAWMKLAAKSHDKARQSSDKIESSLTSAQLSAAQKRAQDVQSQVRTPKPE